MQSYCPPTLSNLSATIPFNIALFISIFIAHYNVALLKKAIDFRIDRGESQLFGRICRRIYPLDHQATTTTATNGRRREALPTFRLRCLCCCPCPTWLQQAYQLAVGQLLPKNSLETASIEAALRRNPYYCLLTPAV